MKWELYPECRLGWAPFGCKYGNSSEQVYDLTATPEAVKVINSFLAIVPFCHLLFQICSHAVSKMAAEVSGMTSRQTVFRRNIFPPLWFPLRSKKTLLRSGSRGGCVMSYWSSVSHMPIPKPVSGEGPLFNQVPQARWEIPSPKHRGCMEEVDTWTKSGSYQDGGRGWRMLRRQSAVPGPEGLRERTLLSAGFFPRADNNVSPCVHDPH